MKRAISRFTKLARTLSAALLFAACSDSGMFIPAPHTIPPVATVAVSPGAIVLEVGKTRQMTVLVRDADGNSLSGRAIEWSTSDEAVARITPTGQLIAVGKGYVTITARSEGKVGGVFATIVLDEPAPIVASVAISPGAIVMEIGQTKQLTATLRDAQGNVLTGRTVEWFTNDTSVARINSLGQLTGIGNGYVTVSARSEGISGGVFATVVREESDYDLIYTRESGIRTQELYVINITDGTQSHINAGTVSRQASPSPTGQRIAFAVSMTDLTTRTEVHDIFAVDRNGMNIKQLTTTDLFEDSPAWSPLGDKIAFRRMSNEGRFDLWVMKADGTEQVKITADLPDRSYVSAPAWSPDGTRIAFGTSNAEGGTRNSIWTMKADGSDKRQITTTLTGFDALPTWSPDGNKIAFLRYYDGDGEIAIVGAAGGQVTRLHLDGLQKQPSWSPDGRFIAYSQDVGVYSAIFTVRPDGTDVRRRTAQQPADGYNAAWIKK